MQRGLIIFIVLLVFCVRPDFLKSLDTVSGRVVMLGAVVYLTRLNVFLGFVAALAMVRAIDRDEVSPIWRPVNDLLDIEILMQPKNSWLQPALRTTAVPVNDVFEPYTVF